MWMFYWCRAKSSICHHYTLFLHSQLAFHAAHIAVFFLNRSLFIYWKAEKCHRWHSLAALITLNLSELLQMGKKKKKVLFACQGSRKTVFPFGDENCIFLSFSLKRTETWFWKGFPGSANVVPCYSGEQSHGTLPIKMDQVPFNTYWGFSSSYSCCVGNNLIYLRVKDFGYNIFFYLISTCLHGQLSHSCGWDSLSNPIHICWLLIGLGQGTEMLWRTGIMWNGNSALPDGAIF